MEKNWKYVDEVKAAGNSTDVIDYTYYIGDASKERMAYYRLVQMDIDGKFEIFGPVAIICDGNKKEMRIFPNPVHDQFTVTYSSDRDQESMLELFDGTGVLVKSIPVTMERGDHSMFIGQLELNPGIYHLHLNGVSQKFIVQ